MKVPGFHGTDVVHLGILADVQVVDVLDGTGQRIGFLGEQFGPFALQMNIIFIVLKAIAFG
jgi:hypothetical protein